MKDENLEVEVKFLVADLTAVRSHLLVLNAILKKARVFEQNIRLDTPDGALLSELRMLRIRQDTAVKVTFKSPPPPETVSEVKVREELEMTVSNAETAVSIFSRLGFSPVQTYEKYRETFQLGKVEIVLDEMPYGNFVELEGAEAEIKALSAQLNLVWEHRILPGYLAMMGMIKITFNLPFDDLTFANFEKYPEARINAISNLVFFNGG